MQYMVGLQFTSDEFLQCIEENKEHIYEVYFSWGDFPNGRNSQIESSLFLPWELQQRQIEVLRRMADSDIKLNLLFNGNCYGADSLSRVFYNKIGDTVDYISTNFGLNSVTVTSPLIAKFIKSNFEGIEVRASVNIGIGTTQGMDYVADCFDSYYMQREYNRDFKKIKELKDWCDNNGKELYVLANSGCLNFCSTHTFHDNLVAHEVQISKMDNAFSFEGVCKKYLEDEKNYISLINDTNFIRPEDISLYEPYFKAVKLATRVHKTPHTVLKSYINQKYSGNILNLLEPAHSIYPYVIENGNPLKIVKLEEEIC